MTELCFVEPDQAIYGAVYQRIFANQGVQINCLPSAAALFEKLEDTYQPDVIVLEKWLPDMDAFRICSLLQQLRAYYDIPIIVVSEAAGLNDRAKALNCGAFDYIPKPFHSAHLKERIQEALKTRRENRRLQQFFTSGETANSSLQATPPEAVAPTANAAESLRQHLQALYEKAQAETQPLSLSLVDVDFMKFYNDAFGHKQGDHSLERIFALLRKAAVKSNVLHYQEDCFAIVDYGRSRQEVLRRAEQFCQRIRLLEIDHANEIDLPCLTVSVGTATLSNHGPYSGNDLNALLEGAQQALFQAKTWGRNQVRQFLEM